MRLDDRLCFSIFCTVSNTLYETYKLFLVWFCFVLCLISNEATLSHSHRGSMSQHSPNSKIVKISLWMIHNDRDRSRENLSYLLRHKIGEFKFLLFVCLVFAHDCLLCSAAMRLALSFWLIYCYFFPSVFCCYCYLFDLWTKVMSWNQLQIGQDYHVLNKPASEQAFLLLIVFLNF